MAKRGPKPKHPKLLEKEGYYRTPPERKQAELTVIEGRPEPTPLVAASDVSMNLWNQTLDLLASMDIVNKTDLFLLEAFVTNYVMVLDLSTKVMQNGHAQQTTTGAKRSPDSQVLLAHLDRHLKYLAELGLTPSARARFAPPAKQQDNSNPLLDVMRDLKGP